MTLDPDEGRLGVDALSPPGDELDRALGASTAPLKARLLDQARVAGIGNLLADEILWRAGLDPVRAGRRPSTPARPPCTARWARSWPTSVPGAAATPATCARRPPSTACAPATARPWSVGRSAGARRGAARVHQL